jgi:hypothetical protein
MILNRQHHGSFGKNKKSASLQSDQRTHPDSGAVEFDARRRTMLVLICPETHWCWGVNVYPLGLAGPGGVSYVGGPSWSCGLRDLGL